MFGLGFGRLVATGLQGLVFLVFVSRLDLQSLGVEDKGSTGLGSPWAGLLFGKLAQPAAQ